MIAQNRYLSSWLGRWGMPIVCLLAFFLMGITTAQQKSATTDEPVHMTRGIVLIQGKDFRLQKEHAPLSHWLISGLLRTEPLPDVTAQDGWEEGDIKRVATALFEGEQVDLWRVWWLSRVPIVLSGLLLGAVMMRWAAEMSGRVGRIAAGILFAFSPNLLAHGSLATTDFVTTVTYTLCLYALWRFWQRPGWGNWLLVGLGLGLGVTAKVTGLLLLPLTGLLSYGHLLFVQPYRWAEWRENFRGAVWRFVRPSLLWLSFLPVAAVVVWAVYRFEVGEVVIPEWELVWNIPAATYVRNLLFVTSHIDNGHLAFLMGEISEEGWWAYFLVALGIKTSLPLLILVLVAVGRRRFGQMVFFWFPAMLLFGIATYTRLNIGYRHILPMLPFLMLWGAVTAGDIWREWVDTDAVYQPFYRTVGLVGLVILLVGHGINGMWHHPDHLAYFNQLVGGSAEGYRYLTDSNLDWGQDWGTAAAYVAENELETVYIAPSGFLSPAVYGLAGQLVHNNGFADPSFVPANPSPGTYLLSVSSYQGMLADPDLLSWFEGQEPVARLGQSIWVYEVEAAAEGAWIAQCSNPLPPLGSEQAAQIVNRPAVRQVHFDCAQSWVFPQHGTAGWYILPLVEDAWWVSEFFPEQFQRVYHHQADGSASGYEVFYWAGSVDVREAFRPEGFTPVVVEDTAALVGYTSNKHEWQTVWEVLEQTNRPLSVLGHLYAGGETPAAVADGLGYWPEQWQVGDVFVQYHPFEVTGDMLETGMYEFTTGKRLITAEGELGIEIEQ